MTTAGRPGSDEGTSGAGPSDEGLRHGFSIGAVLGRLRSEFPDVTISKIRFLESEGLVAPGRTASGYRQFSEADIERLLWVLTAQRDQYLPLKVIKSQLDAADGGDPHGSRGNQPRRSLVAVEDTSASQESTGVARARLTREDMLAEAEIGSELLTELEQYGLIRPGPAGFYDPASVRLARTARAMTQFGIEPRHLRAFRASADREVGLLEQIVAPMYRQHDPDSVARAEETVRELATLSTSLHTLLVEAGLRHLGGR